LILSRINLRDRFSVVVGAGDTPKSKPAPDPYLRAIELLRDGAGLHDVPAHSFVAIEDSRWGIDSALAAGLTCVGITNSYPAAELTTAHLVVSTLAEISAERLRGLVLPGNARSALRSTT